MSGVWLPAFKSLMKKVWIFAFILGAGDAAVDVYKRQRPHRRMLMITMITTGMVTEKTMTVFCS